MITIDGSMGEGGGQILRTALALSMCTGQPFRIENIRAKRAKPGLLRQHLTAVHAAANLCGGFEGATLGSRSLVFEPGKVKRGTYTFSVGSAGSTTLVLQAVLPALLTGFGPTSLTLEGGTHNPHAPPLDFLEKAFLPLVNGMGPKVDVAMQRAGFYPAGGGRFVVTVEPAEKLSPLHLPERGGVRRRVAKAVVAALPGEVAKRELARVEEKLGWTGEQLRVRQLPADWGPGNLLTLEVESEHVTEVFTGFGMKGRLAEMVADDAITEARHYLAAGVPVGPCLADQLLLPLALAGGGSFVTMPPTRHTRTNAEVIGMFLSVKIQMKDLGEGRWSVEVG